MDIFVRNIPPQATEKQFKNFLQSPLRDLNIHTYHFQKFPAKPNGLVTVCDVAAGREFLRLHGVERQNYRQKPIKQLFFHGSPIYCSLSDKSPDKFRVRSLEGQEAERSSTVRPTDQTNRVTQKDPKETRKFEFQHLWNGLWEYTRSGLAFIPYVEDVRGGSVGLGDNCFVIFINPRDSTPAIRLDIPYASIESIITGEGSTVTLTLTYSPQITEPNSDLLNSLMARLGLSDKSKTQRTRLSNFHSGPETVGFCFVYRMEMPRAELHRLSKTIRSIPSAPRAIQFPTSTRSCKNSITNEFQSLLQSLQHHDTSGTLPFSIQFQLQRFAQNGFMSPQSVLALIPRIKLLSSEFENSAIVEALQSVYNTTPFPGPDTDAEIFTITTLIDTVRTHAKSFVKMQSIYASAARHSHLGVIHRAIVTPTGIYLDGPYLETKNRVLRKYPQHTDYFLRVTFSDEDGQEIRREQHVDSTHIFRERFMSKLKSGISVAGRTYVFLGFSHSSLRCHQCWFMAPFVYDGQLYHAQEVIRDLGDFTSIRSPAKCAARIGQTFSDATDTVPISLQSISTIKDIERNGRVFTDGVGTISLQLLKKVWSEFTKTKKLHPTVLQIRLKGAKGVLALDSQLQGEQLCLRPSMTKFEGSNALDLEICGAAFKPLPLYLNRQFIKILEDLGVPAENFLNLQQQAVEKLRAVTTSPVNAAWFLEENRIGTAARTPGLIRYLDDVDIDFQDDTFLRHFVELATLAQLRDIKHRARIPVENGLTLYGIVDETGYLQEGEVHVVTRNDKGSRDVLIRDRAIITKSPALHPGDFQIVRALDVPSDSPLTKLHNCIIFSQHGTRDLPSQLSGGDLDGDLFNVIYEPTLFPQKTVHPADYARAEPVDIQRSVTATDMMEFFVKFMESDQLAIICNAHMQAADQKDLGTLDQSCIKLAEMASVAVDFSKTGIPVDMKLMPRDYSRRTKPDFMANGPRLVLGQNLMFKNDVDFTIDEDFDEDEANAINPAPSRVGYYKSTKALGQLYRRIDETKFLKEMQQHQVDRKPQETKISLVDSKIGHRPITMKLAWDFVQRATRLVAWHHQVHAAREIRESYESNLVDAMFRYSPHERHPLTEIEVFSGTILGKTGGSPNKRIRESCIDMKECFNLDVSFTIDCIERGVSESDDTVDGAGSATDEALARSIACFSIAMTEEGMHVRRVGEIKSFVYVAAAVCLKEVERFQGLGYLDAL